MPTPTSKNYEKQYKDWYTLKFMPACAAYAVAYDYSWGTAVGGMKEQAINREAFFKIPDPAITKHDKEGTPPPPVQTGLVAESAPKDAVTKAYTAFGTAAGFYGGDADASDALQKATAAAVATLGGNHKPNWRAYHDEIAKQMFYLGTGNDALFEMFKPVLKVLADPALGLQGVYSIGQKFNCWSIAGSPDPVMFNTLISSILSYGVSSANPASLFATFKRACKQSGIKKKYFPLCYTAPYDAEGSGAVIENVATATDAWTDEHLSTFTFRSRYLVVQSIDNDDRDTGSRPSPWVSGRPDRFAGLKGDPLPHETAYNLLWKPYAPWMNIISTRMKTKIRIPGGKTDSRIARPSPANADPDPPNPPALWSQNKDDAANLTSGEWMQLSGIAVMSPRALVGSFQAMILNLGRSGRKTSTGKSWYDQIIYEILWGLQDPTPSGPARPRTGGSAPSFRPKPAPKNVGKRKLKEGEIHAVDLQCVLLEKIQSLAQARDATPYKNVGTIRGSMPGNIISKLNHGAPSAGKGGVWPPAEGGPDSEAYTLQNMCPDLWALMVPHLELYRVNYLKRGPSGSTPILIPDSEDQLPFSNFLDQSDVNEITAGTYGRVGGAGIKSFTWSLDGTQPAEVDNLISAKLTMHFQSVYDLFRHNEVPGAPGQFGAGIKDQPGYLDLIIGSGIQGRPQSETANESEEDTEAPSCENFKSEIYESENFRIKVIAGWATPPGFTQMNIPGYTTADLEHIQAAITASRTALYLQIVSHAINFQQDGTLELVIDYQASMSGVMRSPRANIFIGKELYEAEMETLQEMEANLESEEGKALEGRTDATGDQSARDERKKEILAKQIALMRKSRAAKYKEFLRSLHKHQKVRGLMIPTKELLNPLNKMTPEDRAVAAKARYDIDITMASEASTARATARLERETETISTELANPKPEEENKTLQGMYKNVGIFPTKGAKNTLVPFMYLGDLIDAILKSRLPHLVDPDFTGTPVPPMQMMLGNVEMVNPLLAYQIKDITVACAGDSTVQLDLAQIDPFRFRQVAGIFEYINIGSLPISLDKFNEWFVNTVIKEKVDSYPLLNFIRDICSGLISKAYSSVCFEEIFQFHVTFNTSDFRMEDAYRGKSPSLDELAHSARKASINDRARFTPESTLPPSIPTSILYSVDSRPMTGDRISDMQEGVYHYFLGARCGLAKEIVFERQDMPFYREARISKDGSLGAQQLKELYTVNMSMMGNTLHKNGTFVYIDPIAIGAGSSRAIGGIPNIARLIGLGGYFLINSVSSEISPAGFNTQVSAMQQQTSRAADAEGKIVEMNGQPLDEYGRLELTDEDIDWDDENGAGTGSPEEPGPPNIAGDDTGSIFPPPLSEEEAQQVATEAAAARESLEASGVPGDAESLILGSEGFDAVEALTEAGYSQSEIDVFAASLAAVTEAQTSQGYALNIDQAVAAAQQATGMAW
jgi:hypothetical protein